MMTAFRVTKTRRSEITSAKKALRMGDAQICFVHKNPNNAGHRTQHIFTAHATDDRVFKVPKDTGFKGAAHR